MDLQPKVVRRVQRKEIVEILGDCNGVKVSVPGGMELAGRPFMNALASLEGYLVLGLRVL